MSQFARKQLKHKKKPEMGTTEHGFRNMGKVMGDTETNQQPMEENTGLKSRA